MAHPREVFCCSWTKGNGRKKRKGRVFDEPCLYQLSNFYKDTLAPFVFLLLIILQLPRWVLLYMLYMVNVGFNGIQFDAHRIT